MSFLRGVAESIRRWGAATRPRVILQGSTAECGLACAATVLSNFGAAEATIRSLRKIHPVGRDGCSLLDLRSILAKCGIRAEGRQFEPEGYSQIPPQSILHWGGNHFVVLLSRTRRYVHIGDPAVGHRRLSLGDFGRRFAGKALVPLERVDGDSEHAAEPTGVVLGRVKSALKGRLMASVWLFSAALQACGLVTPLVMAFAIDRVLGERRVEARWVLPLAAGVVGAVWLGSALARGLLIQRLREVVDNTLTRDTFERLMRLPFPFFATRSAGDLNARVANISTLRETLANSVLSVLVDGVLSLVYLAGLLATHRGLFLWTLGFMVLYLLVFLVATPRLRDATRDSTLAEVGLQSYQLEVLHGIDTVLAMGSYEAVLSRWRALQQVATVIARRKEVVSALVEAVHGALRVAAPLCLLSVGVFAVLRGEMSVGQMLGGSTLALGVLVPIGSIVSAASVFQVSAGYAERIDEIWLEEPEGNETSLARPLTGAVEVDSVSFTYPGATEPTLRSVRFEVASGEFVAIVGESGAGKSTLLAVLLGLCTPSEGQVRYDGTPADRTRARALRSQFGVVLQTAALFNGSIRDNIRLAVQGATDEEVVAAARLACIDQEIERMPMKYDTVIGERGTLLSGGQRQRIALARALIRRPAVLFIDEGTSSLDADCEDRLSRAIAGLKCTRIVVSHRPSTVAGADRTIRLVRGQVADTPAA